MDKQLMTQKLEASIAGYLRSETGHGPKSVARFMDASNVVQVALSMSEKFCIQTFNGPYIREAAVPYFQTLAGMARVYLAAGHTGKGLFSHRKIVPEFDEGEAIGYTAAGARFVGCAAE